MVASLQIFCGARRDHFKEQSPEANSTEITRLLASTWKAMGPEERKPYIQQHKVTMDSVVLPILIHGIYCDGLDGAGRSGCTQGPEA